MKNVLVLLLTLVYFTSCSPEVDFVEPFTSDEETENENNPEENPEEEIVVSTDPCDFTLENAEAGETIIIDCVMDLGGKTIDLPSDVTFEYDGGDIINGTLNFNNGVIDGRLLNSKLEIKGTARLLDATFEFNPKRWDIVEGKVADEVARKNKENIQKLINFISDIGGKTFIVDKLDAYFKVDVPLSVATPEDAAIRMPSNFTFKMSDNTHIRIQPNDHFRPTLMSVTSGNTNVVIEGGNLYGDRDEHDYSNGETHEWGHIMRIKGANDVTIRNISFIEATGDGLSISSIYHYFDSRHITSQNILITGNRFIRTRRTGISITSAHHVTIENNEFIDSGVNTDKSNGTAPRASINLEPVREWENGIVGGTLVEYEKIENIFVRNNKQRGRGPFLASHGDGPIVFEGNDMESSISFIVANGVEIKNNIFHAEVNGSGSAISAGAAYTIDHPLVFNNQIYDNKIYGYSVGITAGGRNSKIYNNYIEANQGIALSDGTGDGLVESEITNNIIKAGQYGIRAGKYLNNVSIKDNIIEAKTFPLFLSSINSESGQENAKLYVSGNKLMGNLEGNINLSKVSNITDVHGLELVSNQLTGGFQIVGSKNIIVRDNDIHSNATHGIHFFTLPTTNSEVASNRIIIESNSFDCVKEQVLIDGTVLIQNNTCE